MSIEKKRLLGVFLFVLATLVLLPLVSELELNRNLILKGEFWRLWSAHFTHTSIMHWALNICAALLLYFSFFFNVPGQEIFGALFLFPVAISMLMLGIYPNIEWYNGLSGLLHGLLVFFSISYLQQGKYLYWLAILAIITKISVENFSNWDPGLSLTGTMTIVVEAHLIGALTGVCLGILYLPIKMRAST